MRFVRKGLSFKEDEGADIVFTNATIWTGDSIQPWAEFMVLRKGRILRVGNLTQLQYMRIGSKMEVVDLEGKFVTPGFIDSHLHFLHGGLQVCHDSLLYSPVFVHSTG
jgi:predicted amidohydrolase YtcJ